MTVLADSTPVASRRDILAAGAAAALTGVILGAPLHHGSGVDLSAVAQGYIDDAAELGMRFIKGPDGNPWRVVPMNDTDKAREDRERHWTKLGDRPRLMRAVYTAVENSTVANF